MTSQTGTKTVDQQADGVKHDDDGPNVYGSGLQAENDASHLAKMPARELLREFIARAGALAEIWGPNMSIDALSSVAQALNRAQRECEQRMERGALVGSQFARFGIGDEFWVDVRKLATHATDDSKPTQAATRAGFSVAERLNRCGL